MNNSQRDQVRGNIELLVLSVLDNGPMYAYQVIRELRARVERFEFKEGTVYPVLYRLADQGLVETRLGEAEHNGVPVRFYELSDEGRRMLQERWALWDQLVRDMDAVRKTTGIA